MKIVWILVLMVGCSSPAERLYHKALRAEEQKLFAKAAALYQEFAAQYPKNARAPEALVRAAEIFRREFQVTSEAKELYVKVLKEHNDKPQWVTAAKTGLLHTPDYFPLYPGCTWTEGDSATGGKNMRAEITVSTTTAGRSCLSKKIYAAQQLVSDIPLCYESKEDTLMETSSQSPILRYPFQTRETWTGASGIRYTIEDTNATITVRAGTFQGCLKVREQMPGLKSWTYTYYAPYVGKALTTVGTKKGEHRNAELLSYAVPKIPSPLAPEQGYPPEVGLRQSTRGPGGPSGGAGEGQGEGVQ